MSIINLIRPCLNNLSAYKVHNAEGFIKLDAMENPYSLPKSALDEISELIKNIAFNRYPDGNCENVKSAIYNCGLVPREFPIVLGNGSDELIWVLHTLIPEKSLVMALEPSFSMYELNSKICGHNFYKVNLQKDFSLPLDEILMCINREKPALLWLCYPNNPTGNLFNHEDIQKIISANAGFTVVDEAYLPFVNEVSQPTLINKIHDNPRLIILRTLSKMGLAGVRMGYLVTNKTIALEVEKIRLPYNIDRLSGELTTFILNNYHNALIEQTQKIVSERELQVKFFRDNFQTLGLEVFPSKTNFVLVRHQFSQLLYQNLIEHKILIKNFAQTNAMLKDCLRITIGKPDENRRLRVVMAEFFKNI